MVMTDSLKMCVITSLYIGANSLKSLVGILFNGEDLAALSLLISIDINSLSIHWKLKT